MKFSNSHGFQIFKAKWKNYATIRIYVYLYIIIIHASLNFNAIIMFIVVKNKPVKLCGIKKSKISVYEDIKNTFIFLLLMGKS